MSTRLEGKVAVVTGGGSGIGRSVAGALAEEGASVVVADISGDQEAAAKEIGGSTLAVRADVGDEKDVEQMVDAAVSEFGRLDVLCNNAGIDGDIAPTADSTAENFDRVISVNLRGPYLGMRLAIPAMLENGGGSIVNVSSIEGLTAMPGAGAYCASKAGLLGLTRAAAVEYAARGIRVNAICPGVTDTPLIGDTDPALLEQAKMMTPIQRFAGPGEIAATVVFLASDEASYITGAALAVDGGFTAM